MIRTSLPFLILFWLSACQQETASQADPAIAGESARLNAWFETQNEQRLAFSPMEMTYLGRKDAYDQIDDLSVQAAHDYLDWLAASVAELKRRFVYEALDEEAQTSYDVWLYHYQQQQELISFLDHQYIYNQMVGMHTSLPNFLINFHAVDNLNDMHAYLSRLSESARAIRQGLQRAQNNAAIGVRPPRFAYEAVIGESGKLIDGQPFTRTADADAPLWADANNKIGALLEAGEINQEEAKNLSDQAREILLTDFQEAYRELIAWFELDLINADAKARGVHALPRGGDYYAAMLRYHTSTDMTAEEIHQLGLAEVDRISKQMLAIKDHVNFDGSLQSFFTFIESDERFFYPDTDAGRQAYLDDASGFIETIRSVLPDFFGLVPKAEIIVKRVEAFREQDGAAQHYYPGSVDGGRPGIFYAHLSDMSAMPKTEMEAVAYHEGIPGHHMQISIAQESTHLPDFRGQFNFTAFVEGWALYAESLAKEMGAYQDPYADFGRLTAEIWRAIRLVVDTGMHAMGWSEEEAVDYFKAHTPLPEEAIRSEVRRYLTVPGQATAYKIGMLKIQALRAKAQTALGEDFDLRQFHDLVLSGGALPLPILERRIDHWLEQANGITQ